MDGHPSDLPEGYSEGVTVRIDVGDDDIDAERFDGMLCVVEDNMPDSLGEMTGDPMDSHHYQLKRSQDDGDRDEDHTVPSRGETLPLHFRHADLVRAEE